MGVYLSVCRTCSDERLTGSVTEARQHTREHAQQGHDATYRALRLAAFRSEPGGELAPTRTDSNG